MEKICKLCTDSLPISAFGNPHIVKGKPYIRTTCTKCRNYVNRIYKKGEPSPLARATPFFDSEKNAWFKKCTKCEIVKLVDDFAKNKGKPVSHCKVCISKYNEVYSTINRENLRKKSREYQSARPVEKKREAGRKYYQNHPEKSAEHRQKWLAKLTDTERKAFYKKHYQLSFERNPDKYKKIWAELSPEQRKAKYDRYRDSYQKRKMTRRAREMEVAVNIPFTKTEIIKRDGCKCYLCGKELTPKEATIDHVLPLSRGGWHCPSNAKIACKPCNSSKCNKTLEEYLEWKTRLNR